ncbi:glucose-induced degradation protein 8 homolog isoform X2 [Agrilus planipennis]|uniref:Glucose-induced degradation protein 8 homolog isoform X2 n=1 Tax=Agrilus planipennis TaxID=224129 RepID=A0A1W4W434_AGRPL|nr:glucose-induced degradation protein 8 homolog isoform X2 [Agrilus planipennis]
MSYTEKHDSTSKEEWMKTLANKEISRTTINKLIMNYLVIEGFKEAAEKFEMESGVKPSVDLNSLNNRIQIRDAIMNGRIQEATALLNQLHPELLDNDRNLYFHLQQLHLIELIRNNRVEEALAFAQSHLSEAGEDDTSILNELERTVALLAFEDPLNSPFGDLLQPAHRQKVASKVNAAILKMEHQIQISPKLSTLLKLILWSQDQLDKKITKYPKMTDLESATIESPK